MQENQIFIMFHVSAGSGYSIGNFLRCVTLARILLNKAKIFFVLPDTFEWPHEFRVSGIHRVSETNAMGVLKWCQVLIFDYQGPIQAGELFHKWRSVSPNISIIALDYFYLNDPHVNVFINLSDHRETQKPAESTATYLSGLDYAIIRPQFHAIRTESIQKEVVERVLVTFGGEDIKGWTLLTIEWMERFVPGNLSVTVIVGSLNRKRDKIFEYSKGTVWHTYRILDQVSDIERHMKACDIAFSGSGTTIMELAFLGKPVIALPQHEMEERFLTHFEKIDFLLPGAWRALAKMEVEPVRKLFSASQLRAFVSRIGQSCVDGKGAQRIADIILKEAISSSLTRGSYQYQNYLSIT